MLGHPHIHQVRPFARGCVESDIDVCNSVGRHALRTEIATDANAQHFLPGRFGTCNNGGRALENERVAKYCLDMYNHYIHVYHIQ